MLIWPQSALTPPVSSAWGNLDEGPDIVYERLSRFAARTWEVLTVHGSRPVPDFDRSSIESASSHQLSEIVVRWLSRVTKKSLSPDDVSRALVVWSPPVLAVLLDAEPALDMPYDPSQRRSGLVVHFGPLVRLSRLAETHGIAHVPLNPLGLLPGHSGDPLLPNRKHQFSEDQARTFIARHELAEMRAIRYIVERNFAGLAHRLDHYSTLPRKVTIAMAPPEAGWPGDWSVKGSVEVHARTAKSRSWIL